MSQDQKAESRLHDLFGAFLGALAAGLLISTPWQIDTAGPDPFYKGPLLYPLLVLSLMVLASIPSAFRLIRPAEGAPWVLDGRGFPKKPLVVFSLLILFTAGLVVFGLRISCLLFLGSSLYYLGHRRAGALIAIPLIVTAIVFLVFKFFLDIYFPTPLLFELLEQ